MMIKKCTCSLDYITFFREDIQISKLDTIENEWPSISLSVNSIYHHFSFVFVRACDEPTHKREGRKEFHSLVYILKKGRIYVCP